MNWDDRDAWSLGIQLVSLAVTLATLGVTWYFTSQLVKNDNDREKMATDAITLRRYQTTLEKAAGGGKGVLHVVGRQILEMHPENRNLLIEAYTEVSLKYDDQVPSLREFIILLQTPIKRATDS